MPRRHSNKQQMQRIVASVVWYIGQSCIISALEGEPNKALDDTTAGQMQSRFVENAASSFRAAVPKFFGMLLAALNHLRAIWNSR
mmetsp:Transcript_23494/g.50945  ORF Transcript_23494/g.50945 Transcript_23494/m.50945 type:complete len:85 (-) Transcript_23494:179-433(-)